MPPHHASLKRFAAMAVVGALLGTPAAIAATATVYKCVDQHLGLVYTDQRCKGGQQLDIRPGEADPVATARLERVREELDRSAAARIVDLRRVAAQKELDALKRQQRDEDRARSAADSGLTYSSADIPWHPAFLPAYRWHSPRPRRQPMPPSSATDNKAPNPPYLVPRS